MERLSSYFQEFVFAASVHDEMSSQCVCRACEVGAKDCMKKRNGGETFKCRWQVQRHQCSVPSCAQMGGVCKHPFSWSDVCVSVGIASVEDVSILPKSLCTRHYHLVSSNLLSRNGCSFESVTPDYCF